MSARIAIVGDYSPEVTAHRAIPRALELARIALAAPIDWQWLHTRELTNVERDLAAFDGVWLAPASPYANARAALDAARFARTWRRPFLGTCGGFQHALIEFARNVVGMIAADHAETNPHAGSLVIAPLSCALVEEMGEIRMAAGSRLQTAYGAMQASEGYHCRYGLNPAHRDALQRAGMNFSAFDADGDVRGAELPASVHPFYVGTLFQPERAALRGVLPPLVRAFVAAVIAVHTAQPPASVP